MEPTSSPTPPALQSFTNFFRLPTEIRLRIWSFSTPFRPRVIQIYYDPAKESWQAWPDGRGGLPTMALSSREAFAEALKPYTKVFDTYFDLENDTLFISDPMFTLRKPRNTLLGSTYAEKFRNVAITSDQYWGLEESSEEYPEFCPPTPKILREFKNLQTFTMVLSEDGAGDEQERGEFSDSWDSGVEDEPNFGIDEESNTEIPSEDAEQDQQTVAACHVRIRQVLDRRENEAIESMSKGYFRHVGNVYFESAMSNADHWDSWAILKDELAEMCNEEKEKAPDWARPNICIMVVRYGLKPWNECHNTKIHIKGDQADGVVEEEPPKYKRWMRDWEEDFLLR